MARWKGKRDRGSRGGVASGAPNDGGPEAEGRLFSILLTESFHVDFCFLPELQFRVVVRDTGGSRAHLLLAQARWPRPRFIVW